MAAEVWDRIAKLFWLRWQKVVLMLVNERLTVQSSVSDALRYSDQAQTTTSSHRGRAQWARLE